MSYKISLIKKFINNLAKEMHVKIYQEENLPGMMYVEYGYIEGPLYNQKDNERHPNIQSRIMCILHELGHVYYGHTTGRKGYEYLRHYYTNGVLKSEAEAWNFALDQYKKMDFLPTLTKETTDHIWNRKLGSYYRTYLKVGDKPYMSPDLKKPRIEFVFDKPDEYFWKTKERILNSWKV